jgi:hypothetical protein
MVMERLSWNAVRSEPPLEPKRGSVDRASRSPRQRVCGLRTTLPWACVFAVSTLFACMLDKAVSDAVPLAVEPSTALGAIVATRPSSVCTVYPLEDAPNDRGCPAVLGSGADQAPQLIAIIAFMDHDGTIRSLSCPTAANQAESAYFPDAAQAMKLYTQLCA